MARPRKAHRVDDTTLLQAQADARKGSSAHQIALRHQLTMEEAAEVISAVADEVKNAALPHRISLRNMLREQVPAAVGVLMQIAADRTGDGSRILDSKEKREQAGLRMKAADTILKNAIRFLDEDVVRNFFERPEDNASGLQRTIWDYHAGVGDEGAALLSAKPRLVVVPPPSSEGDEE
jgi:hypothetical protein